MPSKLQTYSELAEVTAKQLTDSTENWTSFLTTAARLYKYPYCEQLMIYAQRPDATACADYETWNRRMGRYVKRGSTGIALLDDSGNYPKLRYVFNVSDTGTRSNSREVKLWMLEERHRETVTKALGEGNLAENIEQVSGRLAREYWNDHRRDIIDIVANSFLEEYNIDTIGARFCKAAAVSSTYAIMSRCGMNPDEIYDHEDFLPVFEFNTPDTIAALGTAVSDVSEQILRRIEAIIKNYERTNEYDKSELHESRRLPDSKPDSAESADAGTRQIRQYAPELSERTPTDTLQPADSVGEAIFSSDGDRPDGEPENESADGRVSEVVRSERGSESSRSDEVDRSDEQPESAGGGDNTERADLQLTQGEQLSLFSSEAEQIEYIDRAESMKSMPFASSFSQEEIDTVLKYGGNERDSRMRIVAEFMKEKSAEAHAAFLQNLFHSGNGFKVGRRDISAWYAEDGIHLVPGRSARYEKSAQVISWTDAAARVGELLEQGQFASNVELAEAAGHERQLLAQRLCFLHQDMSEEARRSYFAEFLFSGAFDDASYRIADMLADPMKCEAITDELARFSADFAADHSLLRFNYHKIDEMVRDFRELALMNREFVSDISELPAVEQFITEDEIDELFASHGSGVENGKQRIYDYFTADNSQKEKADFLKNEYGIGGHSHALSRSTGSDEWHDGKGIRLKKDGCYDMQISWQNAVKRIDDLIHHGRYLVNDERTNDGKTRAGDVSEKPVPESTREINTADETVVTSDQPYKIGDTVYLDDTAFEITEIGHFDVQLLDRTLAYPVFRSENRAAFEQKLRQDSRNNGLLSAEPELADNELLDTGDKDNYALLDTIPENFRITDDNLGEGGAKTKFRMNMDAIYTLKTLENEHRNATPDEQETLSKYVGWGGLAEAFDEDNSSWTREYKELKAALTEAEYTATRASTLNAHYTSPTVIKAIYEAVGNMGFQTGNILEPSMGVGNFFGLLPETMKDSRLYGVELDSITGRIAQKLYPNADITVAGFETTDHRDFFDLAVGNVPFGNYKVNDKAYNKLNFSIHDYFFAKTLDHVRPGGVIAFITSRYTMDKESPEVRKYIAERADLLGTIRLPNNTFKKNAGTEVTTDIIFLQKRDRPQVIEPDWVHLGQTDDGIAVNSYFVEHPEMVLGTLKLDDSMYGNAKEVTCEPIEGANLADQLHEAVKNIGGQYREVDLPYLWDVEEMDTSIPADPNVKNYSYAVVDGEVYYRENSRMVKPNLNPNAEARVKGMVELRDCVQKLIDQQLNGGTDEEITQSQTQLGQLYDDYTAKYGLINDRANRQAFADDSSYYLLCSLEILDEEQHLKRKADMFTKRTIKQNVVATLVDTAAEALALSISEKARVDMPYMSQLTGKSENELVSDLRGVIFRLPESPETYVTADEYLSGNVREKLRQAENAAVLDNSFSVNVEALEQAQPKDLDASEIEVRLGATWIDKAYIKQFIVELLEPPYYLRHRIDVNYSEFTAEWNISGKSVDSSNINSYNTYGTDRANAYKIIEDTLNLRDVRIYDTVTDADVKERRVLNAKETTLAQQKQQSIKDAFKDWIWKTPDRRHALVQKYNELFNSTRPREYNGEHITFNGMNPEISLREHQKNAVAHILYGGNTLLAHEVGAGKTFEMVAAAMESKRLGLCSKPLFAVPNHLTEQWASEFLRLYPSANILVTTKKDFEPANRKKFCARIATGNYDAVIMGHSQFEKIPMSKERQEQLLRSQIEEITDGIAELQASNAERFTIKQLERTRKSLEARLSKLQDDSHKDDVIIFEQLGVDRLYVDEAHNYKNLFLYTKMRNVAGLSTTDAQKSSDMFMKCRYLDEITGSKGVVFATGTPVSNSMTELYTMMRYLQHDTLENKHLNHFDAWASTFGETTTAIELAPEGTGYRARTRFAKFFNLPELMNLFKEAADIKTSDQLHLPVPDATYHNVVAKPTEIQQALVQELSERASKVHAGVVDPSVDNMLKITSDGRKLGLDQRIINPDFPDDPMSKVNLCVDNIFQIWQDGKADRLTQLVFSDLSTPKTRTASDKIAAKSVVDAEVHGIVEAVYRDIPDESPFTVYEDIRDKLISRGVPKEEIAFIHDADTEVKKKELFAKVRSGQVRVLLGSTSKMGAGTNVQDRLIALHDLDCPWRPGDLQQRAGRIIRQGNMNPNVHIYRYVTEGTFDAFLCKPSRQSRSSSARL
jgi:N12 class adenine-specific DNA methylase/adenine-specific DNA methylase